MNDMRAPHRRPCPLPHYFSWGKQNTQRSHVKGWILNDHLHFYWLFDAIQIGWEVITDWLAWVMIVVTQMVQTSANDVTSIRQLLYLWHFSFKWRKWRCIYHLLSCCVSCFQETSCHFCKSMHFFIFWNAYFWTLEAIAELQRLCD